MKKTAIITIIETIGLVLWLNIARSGNYALAAITLIVFISLEHTVAFNKAHSRSLFSFSNIPLGRIVISGILETIVWAIWLRMAGEGTYVAGASAALILALNLIIQHNLEFNIIEKKALFSNLLAKRSIKISIIEAATGAIWLILIPINPIVAVIVLLVGLQIEHLEQAKVLEIR